LRGLLHTMRRSLLGSKWHASPHTQLRCAPQARPRSTLFTGSQRVAEQLTADLKGKARPHVSCIFQEK